jgi:hypothetical protein
VASPDLAGGEPGIIYELGGVDGATEPLVETVVGGLDDEATVRGSGNTPVGTPTGW